jgi:hypothetical protein
MKKIILMSSLFLFMVTFASFAQGMRTPQERLKVLNEKLSLTKEQSVKVESILLENDKQIQKLRSSDNPDRNEFRKIMENSNQEILKVLNEKQKVEYNKMLDERKKQYQHNQNKEN